METRWKIWRWVMVWIICTCCSCMERETLGVIFVAKRYTQRRGRTIILMVHFFRWLAAVSFMYRLGALQQRFDKGDFVQVCDHKTGMAASSSKAPPCTFHYIVLVHRHHPRVHLSWFASVVHDEPHVHLRNRCCVLVRSEIFVID